MAVFDPEQGNYTQVDPIEFSGGNPTLYGYVTDPNSVVDLFGLRCPTGGSSNDGTSRVGRWISPEKYDKMVVEGKVQKPYSSAQSYVTNPADPNAFGKQAKPGSVYAEFNVPSDSLRQTKDDWATIPGPGSIYNKLDQSKGKPPILEFPNATDIELKGKK